MAKEIERKFLVKGDSWRGQGNGKRYRQGYLSTVKERTVRVRVAGDKGFITVKGSQCRSDAGPSTSMKSRWPT